MHICLFLFLPVCRLWKQEQARGNVCKDLDFAVERHMQEFKAVVGRRVSKEPEKTYVNELLLRRALRSVRLGDSTLRSFEDLFPDRALAPSGPGYDTSRDGVVLIGKGVVMRSNDPRHAASCSASLAYVENLSPLGWERGDVQVAFAQRGIAGVLVYTRAECNEEVFFAEGYGRARTRVSNWALVQWAHGQNGTRDYVVRIKYFVRIPHPTNGGVAPLRLAICDVYRYLVPKNGGRLYRARVVGWPAYAVDTFNIAQKLVCAFPQGYSSENMYFMKTHNLSSR